VFFEGDADPDDVTATGGFIFQLGGALNGAGYRITEHADVTGFLSPSYGSIGRIRKFNKNVLLHGGDLWTASAGVINVRGDGATDYDYEFKNNIVTGIADTTQDFLSTTTVTNGSSLDFSNNIVLHNGVSSNQMFSLGTTMKTVVMNDNVLSGYLGIIICSVGWNTGGASLDLQRNYFMANPAATGSGTILWNSNCTTLTSDDAHKVLNHIVGPTLPESSGPTAFFNPGLLLLAGPKQTTGYCQNDWLTSLGFESMCAVRGGAGGGGAGGGARTGVAR